MSASETHEAKEEARSKPRRRIVITGFMGAGKTTLARELARLLSCETIDLDDLVAAREGRAPQQLIDEEGEARFREVETKALRAALEETDARIISAGGGAWTLERNRALIWRNDCLTVWLDAPFDLCWRRIRRTGPTRPLARQRERALSLYNERRAHYNLADLRINANDGRSASELAAEVAAKLSKP